MGVRATHHERAARVMMVQFPHAPRFRTRNESRWEPEPSPQARGRIDETTKQDLVFLLFFFFFTYCAICRVHLKIPSVVGC
jgi:hypothetical protein